MELTRGTHHLEVANFPSARVCVISVSDRESVEMVFPILQQRFPFLVVDAPSRTGFGVGIAGVLLARLDALLIGTGLTAGELAETRRYVERLEGLPAAQTVDRRVLPIGDAGESGLALDQLELRLALMPVIGPVPRLGGGVAPQNTITADDLAAAFRPVISWIIDGGTHAARMPAGAAADDGANTRHVANRFYREHD
jgi:hypothetical protein